MKCSSGLRLSHLALLRNLERFERLETGMAGSHSMTQRARDRCHARSQGTTSPGTSISSTCTTTVRTALVPGASRADPRRSTDVAHLADWTREHEGIYRLGHELRRAAASSATVSPRRWGACVAPRRSASAHEAPPRIGGAVAHPGHWPR